MKRRKRRLVQTYSAFGFLLQMELMKQKFKLIPSKFVMKQGKDRLLSIYRTQNFEVDNKSWKKGFIFRVYVAKVEKQVLK